MPKLSYPYGKNGVFQLASGTLVTLDANGMSGELRDADVANMDQVPGWRILPDDPPVQESTPTPEVSTSQPANGKGKRAVAPPEPQDDPVIDRLAAERKWPQ